MSQQKALLLPKKHGELVVGTREIEKPGPGELLVKVLATAMNPIDWKIKKYGLFRDTYPVVLGGDSAGIVEEVGEGVTNLKKGDKVFHEGDFNNRNATFQQYTIVPAEITARIPSNLSFEQAASISGAVCTAALAFYNEIPHGLGMKAPWLEGGRGYYAGKPIFISAGSTTIGQMAIQFARLSGFSPIISTSSPSNFGLLKGLGVTHMIDRRNIYLLANEIAKITNEKIEYAFDGWSSAESQQATYDILASGGKMVIVLAKDIKEVPGKDVTIQGLSAIVHNSENRKMGISLYGHLERLLQEGDIKPSSIEVLPGGLAGIPVGLAKLEAGAVSGTKLVALPWETAQA